MNFLIYETWDHFIPTGASWTNGLLQNNHNVLHAEPKDGSISYVLNKIQQKIDCIIYMDIPDNKETVNDLDIIKQKYPDIKIIATVLNYLDRFDLYKQYLDFVVSMTYQHLSAKIDFENAGYKFYNIPLAGNPSYFMPITSEKYIIKRFDISFIGQFSHGDRNQNKYLFPLLTDNTFKRYMSGFNYNNITFPMTHYSNLNKVYNATAVNLNFHYDYQKGLSDRIDFNGRTFEICLSGGFELCDHPVIKKLIPSMIVQEYGFKWKEIIKYYLNNPYERESIAKKCRDEVLQNHTWKHRMEYLINLVEAL